MKKLSLTRLKLCSPNVRLNTGMTVAKVCRNTGISEATYYNWKKKCSGLSAPELPRVRQLKGENY